MKRLQMTCLMLVVAAWTVGCGDSSSRLSPVAPTKDVASSQPSHLDSASAPVIDFSRNAAGPAKLAMWAAERRWSASADGLTAQATDVITALTGTCPTRTVTIRGTPVALNASTTFSGGATCAGLAVGQTVTVVALVTFSGGTFSVVATEIRANAGGGGHEAEVSGTVASLAGTCPAATLTLVGSGGTVVANASTTFDPVGSCSTIAAGTVIEAHGTRNATGQLVATEIEVTAPESGHGNRFNGEGTISRLTGTCPALSMVVREAHVTTTATTTIEHGACSDLHDGTRVAVTGDRQTDGTIKATVVRITDSPGQGQHFDGEGTIGSITGTCPSVTMTVEGHSVKTSADTMYTGGACADLRAGARISVTGTNVSATLLATSITFLRSRDRD